MYKALIISIVIALGLGYALYDQVLRVPSQTPKIHIIKDDHLAIEELSTPIPQTQFKDLNGKLYTLHDFENKVIILNFWATWCPPCVKEFPQLLELASLKRDEVILVLMSVDENTDEINRFIAQLPDASREQLAMPHVIIAQDTDKHIAHDLFGSVKYPETYIIDRDLLIKRKVSGVIDWTDVEILKMIDGLAY